MRTWLSSILLVVTGAFAVASGCGNPDVVNNDSLFMPDGSVGASGSGASGGSFSLGDAGSSSNGCPSTCDELNANCGKYVTDTKCGGTVDCSSTPCANGEVCGGTEPNRCGVSSGVTPDGGTCTARSCDELGITCGAAVDPKCPGDPLDCGDSCPDNCSHGTCTTTPCVVDPATTCEGRGYNCAQDVDSCGHRLNCGTGSCPTDQKCINNVCTTPPPCIPTTCAALGYTCGQAADGCGNPLNCGSTTCPMPGQTCGGGGVIGQCGCTGACSQIPTCPTTGVSTTLTGKVYDPAGRNPLYHALVYIANNPSDPDLKTFPEGITCDVCGSNAAGSPLVSTPGATDPPAGEYSGVDGSFTLKNVPVGNVTIVIQLGRWRRTFAINVPNSCAPNTLPMAYNGKLLMPATQAEGNIPLMAMVTGSVDSLECVLRKMGIDKGEFTNPADGGRVQFYAGSGSAGQTINPQTPTQDTLFTVTAGQPAINNYDMTILSCQGQAYRTLTDPHQAALRAYADGGGRVFATHYSYTWLDNNKPTPSTANVTDNWNEVAQWHVDENDRSATDTAASPIVGLIDKVTNPKATAFEGWLSAVGALNAAPPDSTTVYVVRHDTDFISTTPGRTQQWLYRKGDDARVCAIQTGNNPLHCTSDANCSLSLCSARTSQTCTTNTDCTAKVCQGRTQTACNVDGDCGTRGPCIANTCQTNTCTGGTNYTGQETPLHFTFNTPVNLKEDLTAKPAVVQCGRVLFSDFHVANASENGEMFPQECGKGISRVTPSAAGGGTCTTDAQCTGTCSAAKTCPWGTACATNADCASTCGGGGICLDPMNPQEKLLEYMIFDLGSCVPPTTCTPKTKTVVCAGQNCGDAPDGCGGLIHCGDCPSGESCGVGQPPVANVCGTITCTPKACPTTQECGYASDGCDSSVLCGTCPTGQTCNNGKCGSTTCTPESCADQGIECGSAGDQCGKLIDCPACPAKDTCVNGKCVPLTCVPQTCLAQKIYCGQAADGCGKLIASCGDCPSGDLCVAGQCVHVN